MMNEGQIRDIFISEDSLKAATDWWSLMLLLKNKKLISYEMWPSLLCEPKYKTHIFY